MIRLALLCALLVATNTASAGALRGDPDAEALCPLASAPNPDLAAVPNCDGECKAAAIARCQAMAQPGMRAAAGSKSLLAGTSWQASVVSGIGTFVGDRARQEVEAWFESFVRDHLCELKTNNEKWFPHTCKLLDDESVQLASPLLLEAIRQDIPAFLYGLIDHIEARSKALGPIASALPAITAIGVKLLSGENPLVILRDTAGSDALRQVCQKRSNQKEMTGACLVVFAGVTVDFFGPLIKSPNAVTVDDVKQLAVALLAEGKYRCTVLQAIAGAEDCTKPDADKNLPTVLEPLLAATVITTPATIDLVFKLVRDASEVNKFLLRPTGTRAEQIARTLELLDPVWNDIAKLAWSADPPRAFRLFHDTLDVATVLARGEYRAVVLKLLALAADSGVKLPEWASRLIPMVTDLIEAESAGDVSAALERAAAPIGGWRLKRVKPLLSVSALVGGGVGYEAPFRDKLGMQKLDGGWAGGLMAPIGLQGSIPVGSSTLGLLVSVLDVGQVAWARIEAKTQDADDAGTKSLPDASLSQVLSLGAYAVIGIGNSPFTVGLGASIAPELRSYTVDLSGAPTDRSVTVWRAGAFLAVDVTIFPLF